jgi:kynurenine formamidase
MGMADRTPTTVEEYEAYKTRLSNWGRWGDDDQLGTLNFITREVRLAASSLVTEGVSVSCSNPIATERILPDPARNPRPADHEMDVRPGMSLDYIGVYYHGFANTHIDALCHIFTEEGGELYNGRSLSMITEEGAQTNSIEHWRDGIVTRGVLYDIPRMRGIKYVEDGHPVEAWDLEDCASHQGVEPRTGDAVLIRSGCDPFWAAHPDLQLEYPPNTPGVAASTLEFLYEHDAALLAWDLQEASGQQRFGFRTPMHRVAIPYMGLPLLDNANFERLAAMCAERGRYDFLFVVSPLVIEGGTGSPVNPIAVF